MEAGAYLQQRGDAAAVTDVAGAWGGDMGEELEERALAGAVLTDDADDIALLYLEGDVLQRPYIVGCALGGAVVHLAYLQIGVFFT